jgi:hypothetical protein
MGAFSASDAAVEGFEVLRRHWRAAIGWAGFHLVALVALCILLFILLLGVVPFAGSREAAGTLGAAIGGVLLGIGSGAIELIVFCGLYRLLLRPDEPGFLHLRLGRDEARVLGASLLLIAIAVPLLAITALLVVAAGRISPVLAVVAALIVLLADYALLLRLGLTPVIAFAERQISPTESWRRTRGQTWRLLGMALLLLCLMGLIAVVTWLVVFVVSGLLTGFQDLNFGDAETLAAHPGRFILQLAFEILLAPMFLIIGQAPWVVVYRALSPPAEAA